MFKLVEMAIGWFLVVKENDNISDLPVNVHGIIRVNENYNDELYTNFPNGMSKELIESNEVDNLRKEVVKVTAEAIADEFGD